MKPSASEAIMAIRCSEVGAISEISAMSRSRQAGRNSSFSSYGKSGRIRPSMPVRRQLSRKRSAP